MPARRSIHAWVEVYEQEALAEARRCDREFQAGDRRGPLHGIPVGVKDIIDVRGQCTRCGTPVYPATHPRRGRPGHRPSPERRGDLPGQDGDDPLRQQRPHDHPEPLESRTHAGRVEQRLRRRRGGPDVPGGPGDADGGLAPPARRLQRDRRLQGDLRRGEQRGGPPELLDHRPCRLPLPLGGRRRDPLALHARGGAPPLRPDAGAAPAAPAPGSRAPRRVWATSGSFSRRRPPPRSWKTSPPSGRSFLQAGAEIVEIALPPSFAFVDPRLGHHQAGGTLRLSPPPLRGLPGGVPAEAQGPPGKGSVDLRPRVCRIPAPPDPLPAGDVPADGRCGRGDHADRLDDGAPGALLHRIERLQPPWSVSGFPAMSLPTGLDANGLPFAMQMAAQPYGEETAPRRGRLVRKGPGVHGSPSGSLDPLRHMDGFPGGDSGSLRISTPEEHCGVVKSPGNKKGCR